MKKLFYVEIICNRTKDFLSEDEKNLIKWKEQIDFEYIGLVEDTLDNPSVIDWIDMIHNVFPEKDIIYISDGKRFLQNDEFINNLVLKSPIKICIVLPEEGEEWYLNAFSLMLRRTKYRFLRNGQDAVEGYHFYLIDKKHKVDIELYKHIPLNQKEGKREHEYLNMLGNRDLFKYTNRRKFMPLLRDGMLFKCRYAYILWEYWKNNHITIKSMPNYKYLLKKFRKIVIENVFFNPKQFIKETSFYEETELCSMCPGSVECVAHLKSNTDT